MQKFRKVPCINFDNTCLTTFWVQSWPRLAQTSQSKNGRDLVLKFFKFTWYCNLLQKIKKIDEYQLLLKLERLHFGPF